MIDQELSDTEKLQLLKKYLVIIGDEIMAIINDKNSYEKLKRHLWYYASSYTAQDGTTLERFYSALKRTDNQKQKSTTTTTTTTSTSSMMIRSDGKGKSSQKL